VSTTKATTSREIEQDSTGWLESRERSVFLIAAAAVYLSVWLYTDGLSFPIYGDESQFWKLTVDFADDYPPSIEEIRTYPEPMTPLSFLMFGLLEHLFRGGIEIGRHLNFLTSFAMLCIVACYRGENRNSVLAAIGLASYPYFLPMGMHLYTDLPAAFFVLMAFRMPSRSWGRGLLLALAVATRQYMFVFPMGLVLDECYRAYRSGQYRQLTQCLPDAMAAISLIGWISFFGGLGPNAGLTQWPRHLESLGIFRPMLGLHFLSTMGIYFVLPEFVLYRGVNRGVDRWLDRSVDRSVERPVDRRVPWRDLLWSKKSLIIAGVLLAMYFIDPPIFVGGLKQGFFGRVADYLPIPLRMVVFFFFAWIAAVRFARINLPFWILTMQLIIVLNAFSAWEKYALPIVASFWMMKAMGKLEEEASGQDPVEAGG
jgi:hypothetical protein